MRQFAGAFVGYAALAYAGSLLYAANSSVPFFWPANAFVVCLLLPAPFSSWWRVITALVAAEVTVDLFNGLPWVGAAGLAVANAVESTLTAALLRRWFGQKPLAVERVADMARVLALFFSTPLISGLIGVSALSAAGLSEWTVGSYRAWWVGDAVGLTLCTFSFQAILSRSMFSGTDEPLFRRQTAAILVSIPLLVTVGPHFLGDLERVVSVGFVFLIWAGLRYRVTLLALFVLEVAVTAVAVAAHDHTGSYFALADHASSALSLQVFLICSFVGATFLSLVVAERDAVQTKLVHHVLQVSTLGKMAALGEMGASIAHEINTPLAIISGKASVAKVKLAKNHGGTSAEVIDLMSDIERTVQRVVRIVKGLLAYTRGGPDEQATEVNLGLLIGEAVSIVEERYRSYGVRLTLQVPPDINLVCRSLQIQQIILNLLSNAMDAVSRQEVRDVLLRAATVDGMAIISVTDSGPPLSEDVRRRLMEPFFTTKPAGSGTGLGLALSRSIALRHGGDLKLDEQSTATKFVLKIPMAAAPAAQAA